MEEIDLALHSLMVLVITGAISIIGLYTVLLMKKLSLRISKEAKKIGDSELREKAQDAIFTINEIIATTVFALQVTLVKEIREKAADGKLTPEEAEMVFNIAKQQITEQLSEELIKSAQYSIEDVEGYIANKIEMALQEIKDKII